MKRKSIALFLVAIMFLPTYIIIAQYYSTRNNPTGTRFVSHIYVVHPDGDPDEPEVFQSGSELYRLFQNITRGAESVALLPAGVSSQPYFLVTFHALGMVTTYRYYITADPRISYFVGPIGSNNERVFKISLASATEFLNSPYAESIYDISRLPILTIGDTHVPARTFDWEFQLQSGEFAPSSATWDGVRPVHAVVGNIPLNFSPNFSIEPSRVTVEIRNSDGDILFNRAPLANLVNLEIPAASMAVDMNIWAYWDDGERPFRGQAEFHVRAMMHSMPLFYLAQDTINFGEFVMISGINVMDPDSIVFQSNPPLRGSDVQFFQDGDNVRALIPFGLSQGLFEPGEHEFHFTVTAGAHTTSLDLTVYSRAMNTWGTRTVPRDRMPSAMVNQHAPVPFIHNPYDAVFEIIESQIRANTDFSRSFGDAAFARGWHNTNSGANATLTRSRFGDFITLQSTNLRYQTQDYHFVGNLGVTSAAAVADGTVVFIGDGSQNYLGQFVVVCHGFGLLSWYSNLSRVDVSLGDAVSRGDLLGRSGGAGLVEMSNANRSMSLRVALTVFGTPVTMSCVMENGVIFGDPES